jgi:transcriptional regulator with XRE-family HTH domain
MDSKVIGNYIKLLRKAKEMTLIELSELSGVSNPYLSQIENGKFKPSPGILKKISEPLGISYQELMVRAGHITYEDWSNNKPDTDNKELNELFLPEMLGPHPSNDLKISLKEDGFFFYNGHRLSGQDRQRILDMLKALFPQYEMKGE